MKESERVREMWRMNCAQVVGFDDAITAIDDEITSLKAKIAELETFPCRRHVSSLLPPPTTTPVSHPLHLGSVAIRLPDPTSCALHASTSTRQGKAPPMNEFNGEDSDCLLQDWLPSHERGSRWNQDERT